MSTIRILVCGGRTYAGREAVFGTLDDLVSRHGSAVVIQGGAAGADALARDWCFDRRHRYENYPARWRKHGKAAGPIRNAQMLAEGKPDVVIAFPGGRGTADMVRQAEAAGVPVVRADLAPTPTATAGREPDPAHRAARDGGGR